MPTPHEGVGVEGSTSISPDVELIVACLLVARLNAEAALDGLCKARHVRHPLCVHGTLPLAQLRQLKVHHAVDVTHCKTHPLQCNRIASNIPKQLCCTTAFEELQQRRLLVGHVQNI